MIAYRYKLYRNKKTKRLEEMYCEASFVWNHALQLQKRYYSLYHRYIGISKMKAHYAKRIKPCRLHSQTVQEILERLDIAYQRFFEHHAARPPKFRKAEYFRSFVFKQGGFSLAGNRIRINKISKTYRFSLSRPYLGNVKRVTIKRSRLGEFFVIITTDAAAEKCGKTLQGASVGIDFGLKTYLTLKRRHTDTESMLPEERPSKDQDEGAKALVVREGLRQP